MDSITDAITDTDDGAVMELEVSAASRRDRFPAGYNTWRHAIRIEVRAPPAGGKANRAVVECIASALHLPQSRITILAGHTSTQKRVRVDGAVAEEVARLIKQLMPPEHS
ncbi:MAG: DUF167 domain-containing protein [Methanomicrobiaceae archaeon]|nr:DUF167 domain-containing protein [Methanomicrobiaceae archaeon]